MCGGQRLLELRQHGSVGINRARCRREALIERIALNLLRCKSGRECGNLGRMITQHRLCLVCVFLERRVLFVHLQLRLLGGERALRGLAQPVLCKLAKPCFQLGLVHEHGYFALQLAVLARNVSHELLELHDPLPIQPCTLVGEPALVRRQLGTVKRCLLQRSDACSLLSSDAFFFVPHLLVEIGSQPRRLQLEREHGLDERFLH